jgi:ketosteroid isomerase-like protein
MSDDPRLARVAGFFEGLSRDDLSRLAEHYASDARFKDPFNDVVGIEPIRQVFEHMFAVLDGPRFLIGERVVQGDDAFLTWDFRFRLKRWRRGEQSIRGATHLRFGADGRITLHRDYWDAAEELYEKLPALGALMRWLRRQANRT